MVSPSIRLIFVGLVLLVYFMSTSTIEAKALFEESASQEIVRERRDVQGLFDIVASFFKADSTGKSPAGNALTGLFSAMQGLGKAAAAST